MATPWDARTYDVLSTPQQAWASDVLARLHRIPRDATVLDVGCGTGRVTESLLALVPRGSVLAIDASEDMVTLARSRLGDRAQMWCQDVLDLAEAVDVIISTAALHWGDHDRMLGTAGPRAGPGRDPRSAVWRPGATSLVSASSSTGSPRTLSPSWWAGLPGCSRARRRPSGACARPASARFGAGWKTGQRTPRTSARLSAPRSWRHTSHACPKKGGMRSSPPSWAACALRWTTCG